MQRIRVNRNKLEDALARSKHGSKDENEVVYLYVAKAGEPAPGLPSARMDLSHVGSLSIPETLFLSNLTDRQQTILQLVSEGLPNKAIARRIETSVDTVRNDLKRAFRELSVSNRTAAALTYLRLRNGEF